MTTGPDELEKLRLEWLQKNVLNRVDRSASEGAKISAWLVTGSAGLLVFALKAEAESSGVTIGARLLLLLILSVALAALGALVGYAISFLAVGAFDEGANRTEETLWQSSGSPKRREVADVKHGQKVTGRYDRWLPILLPTALVSHALSAAVLITTGMVAITRWG